MYDRTGILLDEIALDETVLRALSNAETSVEVLEELSFDEEITITDIDPRTRRELRDEFEDPLLEDDELEDDL